MLVINRQRESKVRSSQRSRDLWPSSWGYLPLSWTLSLAAAKSLQSCPTLCNPTDSSPPGSPVPGIHQARTLEWVAISFSNAWKWKVKGKSLSRVRFLVTPWNAAYQAPPSMGFSGQEYWSGVPLPSLVLLVIQCLKTVAVYGLSSFPAVYGGTMSLVPVILLRK